MKNLLLWLFKPRWEVHKGEEVASSWFIYSNAKNDANSRNWDLWFKDDKWFAPDEHFGEDVYRVRRRENVHRHS